MKNCRLLFIVSLLLPAGTARCQSSPTNPQTTRVSADVLLDRWRNAVRGSYKGDLHTVTITSSTHEAGFSGTETLVATAHERMRVERTKANFERTELVLNGDKVWAKDANGFVLELTGPDAEATISEYFEAAFPLLDSVRPCKDEIHNSTAAETTIEVTPCKGLPILYMLDSSTGLPNKTVRRVGSDVITTTFESWQNVRGVRIPGRTSQISGDERTLAIRELENTSTNTKVPPKLFTQPAAESDAVFMDGDVVRGITIQRISGFIVVPAKLNEVPLWFMWDSGASLTVLNQDRAVQAGVHPKGSSAVGTSGGSTGMSLAKDVSIAIGSALLRNQHVGVVQLSAYEAGLGFPFGGILGFDFTSRFVVEIDFEHNKMSLFNPKTFRANRTDVTLPIRIEDKNPFVSAEILLPSGRRVPGVFDLDTGETKGLFLNAPFVRNHQLLEAAENPNQKVGARATEQDFTNSVSVKGNVSEFELGPFSIKHPPTGFALEGTSGFVANPFYAGIFGNQILERFHIWLDYSRKELVLAPTQRINEPFPVPQSFGLLLIAQGTDLKTIKVVRVTPGSPAEAAGFRVGDVITTIDGTPTCQLPLQEVREFFDAEGQRAVTVNRNGTDIQLFINVKLAPIK